MKFNNYYQEAILLITICFVQISSADQENDFSVHINGTRIELVSILPDCEKPETTDSLNLTVPSTPDANRKVCLYQISDIDSINSQDSESDFRWNDSSEYIEQYSLLFYFKTPSTPAEFFTAEQPEITYSKNLHCHSQYESVLGGYITSCSPESPETTMGRVHYRGNMWQEPPVECQARENYQGSLITLKPVTTDIPQITPTMFSEALLGVQTKSATLEIDLESFWYQVNKKFKFEYLQNTNQILQVNGLFDCCFSCFRPRTQSSVANPMVRRKWNPNTNHYTSRGDGEGDLSRQNSVRSTASSTISSPLRRPQTPGPQSKHPHSTSEQAGEDKKIYSSPI